MFRLAVVVLAALLLGAQMMSIGFLAELIIANQSSEQLPYSIEERTPRQEDGASR